MTIMFGTYFWLLMVRWYYKLLAKCFEFHHPFSLSLLHEFFLKHTHTYRELLELGCYCHWGYNKPNSSRRRNTDLSTFKVQKSGFKNMLDKVLLR